MEAKTLCDLLLKKKKGVQLVKRALDDRFRGFDVSASAAYLMGVLRALTTHLCCGRRLLRRRRSSSSSSNALT